MSGPGERRDPSTAGAGAGSGLSAGEAEAIDRLCDRFEAAWRAGRRPRPEDYLDDVADPLRDALRGELVAIELEWRRRGDSIPAGPAARGSAEAPTGESFLDRLGAALGLAPPVLLRDAEGDPEPPLLPTDARRDAGSRYRIDGEIARGGMGAILRGHDPDLGRDVALKVLRDDLRDDPDLARRFVEEAQIGGQLQHPGVVPIYEVGILGDRRPFFSMKLVRGETLARLLRGRAGPGDDRARFLAVFESVAQTVAYAHARGVIHRDLKPSNVMVGAFGEVQVMDWGLAKVLPRGGLADDEAAGRADGEEAAIATARSGRGDSADLSRAGSVLGTPSFMAPEQARGEIARVDERADVFALGSILCEVLTGEPAYTGRSPEEIRRRAALGETAEALARLDACGADAELVALARDCLSREPEGRPRTAGAVAARVTAYQAGVQERLRRAELRSVEERARRRLTTVAASAVLLVGLLGGGGYLRDQRQRADRRAGTARAVDEALADAARLLGEARSAPPGDAGRWSAATAASARAKALLAQGEADATLRDRVAGFVTAVERDRLAAAERARQIEVDRVLLADLEAVRGGRVHHRDMKQSDGEYAAVFRRAGLDLDAAGPVAAGAWLRARTEPVEMCGYLDDWAFVRQRLGRSEADWRRLVGAARAGDPDPWRDALRAKFGRPDAATVAELRRLAGDPRLEEQPAPGLLLLARVLKFGLDDGNGAAEVLRRAARRHPGDFRVHFELALAPGATLESYLSSHDIFPVPAEAVAHLRAALGIRPASVPTRLVLAIAQIASDRPDEAEAEDREAVRLSPADPIAHGSLGNALRRQGKHEEAEREIRAALRLKPDDASAHAALAIMFSGSVRFEESLPEFREAIRLRPDQHSLRLDYAQALRRATDYAGALAVVREAQALSGRSLVDHHHPPEWFRKIEAQAALAERLPALLEGADRPRSNAERVDIAQMCSDKKLTAAALRFRGQALDEDPKLGASRTLQLRYSAACSALLVADGRGADAGPLDDPARADLRRRALGWLRAELVAWAALVDSGPPPDRVQAVTVCRWWVRDVDLAPARGDALLKLPEAERADWRAFWADYEAMMRRGGEPGPK